MPAFKDNSRGTWYAKFYYIDWQGTKKQKFKRGFDSKKDALSYERKFLEEKSQHTHMTFLTLSELYFADMEKRLKSSTLYSKKHIFETKLLPYFQNLYINDIQPADIRIWQNELMNQNYSKTYLKNVNNQLTAILNYAVRYYGLKNNPCHQAGSIGKNKAEEMKFWTKEEYEQFISSITDNENIRISFMVLYWTGMREGELFALTPNDINLQEKNIRINKTYQRIHGQDFITPPKTTKSNRVVPLPHFLCEELKHYIENKDFEETQRLFPFTKNYLSRAMKHYCDIASVKRIRVHDIRHSHVSLLIHLGFSPLLIAERVGHEKVATTLNTYSHLFPHQQDVLIEALEKIGSETSLCTTNIQTI